MSAPAEPGKATVASPTVAERAALCLGSDSWHTDAVERLGIERIRLPDGPHALRVQPAAGDHVGDRSGRRTPPRGATPLQSDLLGR